MDKKEFEWMYWEEVKQDLKNKGLYLGCVIKVDGSELYAVGVMTTKDGIYYLYDTVWGNLFEPDWVMSIEKFRGLKDES